MYENVPVFTGGQDMTHLFEINIAQYRFLLTILNNAVYQLVQKFVIFQ
jgi:hypothetical protein